MTTAAGSTTCSSNRNCARKRDCSRSQALPGNAAAREAPPRVLSARQAEPAGQSVPRQSLGTMNCPMAKPRPAVPVLLVAAVFSRHADALASGAGEPGRNVWPGRTGKSGPRLRSDRLLRRHDGDRPAQAVFRLPRPDNAGSVGRNQTAHQRPGTRADAVRVVFRGAAGEHRSGLSHAGQVPAGHHQGPGAPRLPARRHFRRGDTALPGRRLRAVAVDLRRLPPAGRPRLPARGPCLLP